LSGSRERKRGSIGKTDTQRGGIQNNLGGLQEKIRAKSGEGGAIEKEREKPQKVNNKQRRRKEKKGGGKV